MCKVIGVKDVKGLIGETMPDNVRRDVKMDLPDGKMGEAGALAHIKGIVAKNVVAKNYIGMGYYGTHVPSCILRNLLENPGWYTAYTPYQAEISQGRMEALFNFQTLVCELTGMEVANSSLLDEGTAAAEAMAMISRALNNKAKNQFFVSDQVYPQTRELVKTRAKYFGFEVIVGDHTAYDFAGNDKLMGALVQYPCSNGVIEDYAAVADALHKHKARLVVAADPLSLVSMKPPSEFGADVVVGSMQRFGVPMFFGGPQAGYMACSKKEVRRMPGRLIGESVDRCGNPAYRLTLQTREQHIRLDKATSNVCTAQVLLANMASMYAVFHRTDGLKAIANRTHGLAQMFASELGKLGVPLASSENFFDTVAFDVSPLSSTAVVEALEAKAINLRVIDEKFVAVSFDETHAPEDIHELVSALTGAGLKGSGATTTVAVDGKMPDAFARTAPYLQQDVFNSIVSETSMMRYLLTLQLKDLALDRSMISLGSCTMKLNAASTLMPCSWPEVAGMHPFAPASQIKGYQQMLDELEKYLCQITGFDACSLQPTSGASGEYAGLLAIRAYQEAQGESHRTVCIIPKSAHGTNPASAAMAGMDIKWIDDSHGVDLEEFKALCEANKDKLCALMVTYPSTRAFFEDGIQEMCDLIHKNGGQVYMDGANMNAQLGLTSPAMIGADVCHLNVHKTLSIPHGGGGPGLGPICCRKHLAPHLPGHPVVQPASGGIGGPVISSSPYGQAGIACIPWMWVTMLGVSGVTDSARYAILNANYMKSVLTQHYKIYPSNANNKCSHEFIMDISPLTATTGIGEEDIAKRLQDYGFHAPTMSWPVPHSLMVEPTESEDKDELDRFCNAMISIREEIRKIEDGTWPKDDNPLKMAPHTQEEVCASEWTHPYSREEAAFPVPWLLQRGKYWPTVARVDNVLGDKKLKLRLSA
jgi:glycine dehydrogenase